MPQAPLPPSTESPVVETLIVPHGTGATSVAITEEAKGAIAALALIPNARNGAYGDTVARLKKAVLDANPELPVTSQERITPDGILGRQILAKALKFLFDEKQITQFTAESIMGNGRGA